MHRVPTHQASLLKSRVLAGLLCVMLAFLVPAEPVHAQASFDCTQVTDVPVSECEALVATYNSTDGPNWNRSDNWLSGTQVDLWYGVTVADGHVAELALRNNNLTGALPAEFGQLSNLQVLYLNRNQLTALPAEIGQLSNLQELHLDENQFTTLPLEIGQLSSLRRLDLYDNELTILPPEIGQLSQLTYLQLFNNRLTTLPLEIGQLSSLHELSLSDNQLSTLPPEIGQLNQLTVLDLANNQFSTLPPEIGQLNQLEILFLYNNQVSTLPPEFGQLSQLEFLYLDGNLLSTLPPEFGQLSQLILLVLSNNQFTTLPPEIGQLSNLQELYLRDNQLSTLPPEFEQLSQLERLGLSGNQFSGPIPAVLTGFDQLHILDLQNNDFCGSVPHFDPSVTVWLDGNPRIGQPCDSDDTSPPVCGEIILEHNADGELTAINTTASDPESGIAQAHFTRLRNLHGFLNNQGPFTQNDTETFDPPTTMVTIRGERIDMTKGGAIVVTLTNGSGLTRQCDPVIETVSAEVPERFALEQNYPNPFNPETTIRFALPETSSVRLVIYDVLGRAVAVLVDETLAAGMYEATWEGTNTTDVAMAGGVYLYRLTAGTFMDTRSMILQK